ncbi:MAG: hypothetical protein IT291_03445 [Deltaproteobacteria bacterium]|nr:hypothetical protein [Deltaproteobacteria bacterium]
MDNIIGHSSTLQLLQHMASRDRLPHALLFSGPPAVGKQLIARAFVVQCMLSIKKRLKPAIDIEANCEKLVRNGTHPDFCNIIVEDGKKDISVGQVRALTKELYLQPYYPGCKFALINDAHRMSIAGSNALLMLLEEPPPNTYIILVSEAAHRLPRTIVSRCQVVHFSYLRQEDLRQVIRKLLNAQSEEESMVERLTRICDGTLAPLCVGDFVDSRSLSILDSNGLKKHLASIDVECASLHRQLLQIAARHESAVSIATTLAQDADKQVILWPAIRTFARYELQKACVERRDVALWADFGMQVLCAEQLVRERNANLELQLSNLLLRQL